MPLDKTIKKLVRSVIKGVDFIGHTIRFLTHYQSLSKFYNMYKFMIRFNLNLFRDFPTSVSPASK